MEKGRLLEIEFRILVGIEVIGVEVGMGVKVSYELWV